MKSKEEIEKVIETFKKPRSDNNSFMKIDEVRKQIVRYLEWVLED